VSVLRIITASGLFACVVRAEPQNFTHHVFGLFSPDREADLREAVAKLPGVAVVSVDFDRAEVVFNYDPGVAFKGVKPEKIVERFDNDLRGKSHSTFGILPPVTVPREKLTRIEIPVSGLDCKACCFVAYQSVAKIEGVAQAAASFRDGRVTALIDAEKTSTAALEEALKKRGVTLKKP